MKIGITGINNSIEGPFNPRFGRSEYFLIIDTETGAWDGFPNPATYARGGAGPQAVQFIADKGVEAVVSGRFGPSAFTALEAAGIKVYIADHQGTVKEVLEKFQSDELAMVNAPTGHGFHGK
jgi:predicted Fe-Mo cluster-binding NifX family protein